MANQSPGYDVVTSYKDAPTTPSRLEESPSPTARLDHRLFVPQALDFLEG